MSEQENIFSYANFISYILGIISALIGVYFTHFFEQVRERKKAKNNLDEVLFKEKQAIQNGKREPNIDFNSAIASQEIAYRNLTRYFSRFTKKEDERIDKIWTLYFNAIRRRPEHMKKLCFKQTQGELLYNECIYEVKKHLDALIEAIK